MGLQLGLSLGKTACVTYPKPFCPINGLLRGLPQDNTLPPPFSIDKRLYSAISGVEIKREINPSARRVYISARVCQAFFLDFPPNPHLPYDASSFPLKRLPVNVSILPEIRRFHASNASVELVTEQ
ncbi:hypothetical protein B0H14DRAFT_2591183 [Mycena olivaceomarginata]|nr:hypothetical protein B0H14DRAFT_2591183 [Mycena olivaceomarginata]